jgi:transposase
LRFAFSTHQTRENLKGTKPTTIRIFRSRRGTSIRILVYDGQGFWLAQKRLSQGKFVWWPSGKEAVRRLEAHQAQLLLAAGNPETSVAPVWRKVS